MPLIAERTQQFDDRIPQAVVALVYHCVVAVSDLRAGFLGGGPASLISGRRTVKLDMVGLGARVSPSGC